MRVACHRSVKLHHAEAVRFGLRKAVRHSFSPMCSPRKEAATAQLTLAMQPQGQMLFGEECIIPRHAPGCGLFCRDGIGLRGKERRAGGFVRRFFLREGLAVFRQAIPDRVYLWDILRAIGAGLNAESDRCILL